VGGGVAGLHRLGPGRLARRPAGALPEPGDGVRRLPDSTLDRLAEGVIIGAIGITFAQDHNIWGLAACFVALTASFIVSYARARAEGLGIPGSSGGLMGRPERLVIVGAALFLGSVGDVLPVGMAILAGLCLMTAGHRMLLVYRAST
jgi:CDP-diacylglycerol--glycerol-3-phosphate 3-phosphatidyltransferase